ncbi:hypothetical protein I4U23_002661 [Adineta vaga]|nr:hypothetical protein I4U23_002661 [Adineta vaga]
MSCISNTSPTITNDNQHQEASTGYLKDHFNVSFVDCKCCCDASKEISRCQTSSSEFLRDIQEYLTMPEYRLNCRCICGDNEENNTPMKFGINVTPANDLK